MTATDVPVSDRERVAELTDRLLAEHKDSDQTAFLGAMFDAGLAWLRFPVGQGGLGLPPKLQEVVDERLDATGRRPVWMRNPMGIGMVAPTLVEWGTDDQRRFLRKIWTAEELWCQLFSEPGAGSDVATLATRGERDGDEWIVNGQKVWTSMAYEARWGLLLARTDPDVPKHDGLTAFILDMHAAGVEVRPLRQMSGDAEFNEVYLTDVRIPDSMRIGDAGLGWRVARTTLMNERVSIGGVVQPRGSGPIARLVHAWNTLPRDRRDAARADAVCKLWVDAEVLRLGNLRAQQLREVGTPGPEGSVLKLAGALLDQRIANQIVDLLGPAGMLHPDYDAPNKHGRATAVTGLLGAQSLTIAGGSTEIQKNILGERVLGLPREPQADKGVAWSHIPRGA
jgi:alkylation response protein AidB-like acyl-CoA dehydrogenase